MWFMQIFGAKRLTQVVLFMFITTAVMILTPGLAGQIGGPALGLVFALLIDLAS